MIALLAVLGALIELLEIPTIIFLLIFLVKTINAHKSLTKKVESLEWQLAEILPEVSNIPLPPEMKINRFFDLHEKAKEEHEKIR